MQFINYFFASIISFSGLLIGILLVKIAPEEQKPLEKYFILLGKALLLVIFIFMLFYYSNKWLYLLAYFIFLFFIQYKINDFLRESAIIYTALGVLFFLSSKNANLFTIESSLIFLYGMPTASLIYNKKEKNYDEIILYNIGFILIANLLFFI